MTCSTETFDRTPLLKHVLISSRDVPRNVFTSTSYHAKASYHISASRSASQPSLLGSHFCLFLSLLRFSNHRGLIFEPVNEMRLIRALSEFVKFFFQKKFIARFLAIGNRQQAVGNSMRTLCVSPKTFQVLASLKACIFNVFPDMRQHPFDA